MSKRRLATIVVFAVLLAGVPARAQQTAKQDGSTEAKERMAAEVDPVDRAKAFAKYGHGMIRDARDAAKGGDYERAEKVLTEYRDTLKRLHEALRARVSDPERKPNGFKQLQIHVRKSLNDIDDLVASVPAALQPPFTFLRGEIDRLDRALIDDLFPRKPNSRDPQKGKT